MTSESPSRSPISLTIASELAVLAIVVSLPVERAYWRQSREGASRPCGAAPTVRNKDARQESRAQRLRFLLATAYSSGGGGSFSISLKRLRAVSSSSFGVSGASAPLGWARCASDGSSTTSTSTSSCTARYG